MYFSINLNLVFCRDFAVLEDNSLYTHASYYMYNSIWEFLFFFLLWETNAGSLQHQLFPN